MPRHAVSPLAGSTVVITGAASGIGRALACRLSAHGCPVAISDWDEEGLRETASLIDGPALVRRLDVREWQSWMAVAAEVKEWAPAPIGAVFNNAGVALTASVANGAPEDHEWLTSINLDGVVSGTRAFLPILLEQRAGAIVNTSSVFGLMGVPFQSAYCAAKFAVRGYTESLRQELAGTGVRAVTVHPGGIKTNIARNGRTYEDPTGAGLTHDQMADEFENFAITTPEKAAEIIHRGVDGGRARILVGPDAYLIDAMVRIAPTQYAWIVKQSSKVQNWQARRIVARQGAAATTTTTA